jgi:hypothetical protein
MAGGAQYVLNKGYPVLKTYNSSAAAGVTANRCVKFAVASSKAFVDLNATAATMSLGVVQENIDAVKVAYGQAVANIAILGICKVVVTTGTSLVLGSKVMAAANGGVILATSTNFVVGVIVGQTVPGGTIAAGDLVDILLTPGMVA